MAEGFLLVSGKRKRCFRAACQKTGEVSMSRLKPVKPCSGAKKARIRAQGRTGYERGGSSPDGSRAWSATTPEVGFSEKADRAVAAALYTSLSGSENEASLKRAFPVAAERGHAATRQEPARLLETLKALDGSRALGKFLS